MIFGNLERVDDVIILQVFKKSVYKFTGAKLGHSVGVLHTRFVYLKQQQLSLTVDITDEHKNLILKYEAIIETFDKIISEAKEKEGKINGVQK